MFVPPGSGVVHPAGGDFTQKQRASRPAALQQFKAFADGRIVTVPLAGLMSHFSPAGPSVLGSGTIDALTVLLTSLRSSQRSPVTNGLPEIDLRGFALICITPAELRESHRRQRKIAERDAFHHLPKQVLHADEPGASALASASDQNRGGDRDNPFETAPHLPLASRDTFDSSSCSCIRDLLTS
jgi:hypothetical protein